MVEDAALDGHRPDERQRGGREEGLVDLRRLEGGGESSWSVRWPWGSRLAAPGQCGGPGHGDRGDQHDVPAGPGHVESRGKYDISFDESMSDERLVEAPSGSFYAQRTLLNVPISPADQVAAIRFLIGPDASRTTGQVSCMSMAVWPTRSSDEPEPGGFHATRLFPAGKVREDRLAEYRDYEEVWPEMLGSLP